jgi:hypothetical protein
MNATSSSSKGTRTRAKRANATRRAHRANAGRKSSARKKSGATRKPSARKTTGRRWSAGVMAHSDALDLRESIFKSGSPRAIARSLKSSAEASRRRKGTPFQSAMSMLNFYINRGGSNLSAHRKQILTRAKGELRVAFHRA